MNNENYILRSRGLTKRFGNLTAVDDLDLTIKKREIFGFLGPNGAGKTTAIRMMVGLLEPTSGKITFRGSGKFRPEENLGVCPQEFVFWEQLTCGENLRFIGRMYDVPERQLTSRVETLLKELNLKDKAGSRASSLSGGMKRKLNLGMSLVHDPDLVILDEPSAGLDPQSRLSLWEYIRALREQKGRTVILTTHLMEEADRLCDRVGIMNQGKLLVVDTPKKLKKSVGEEDSITITLENPETNSEALQLLKELKETVEAREVENSLVLRAPNAVARLPNYIDKLGHAGLVVSEVSISRTNTLEDVFIHLTGRRLQE
ncbi:MAG: ABC transporter ATP-binding protein [Candidatus Acetothermia bacterium]